jgi:hypothetical protein
LVDVADDRPARDGRVHMPVRKIAIADAAFERSPGQEGDVFVADLIGRQQVPWSPSASAAEGRTRASRRRWPSTT